MTDAWAAFIVGLLVGMVPGVLLGAAAHALAWRAVRWWEQDGLRAGPGPVPTPHMDDPGEWSPPKGAR